MNTCVVCLGEENSTNLIEYNHCGLYHIHKSCLNKWQKDECFICREKIESTTEEDNNCREKIESTSEEDNNCRISWVVSALCHISGAVCMLLIFI